MNNRKTNQNPPNNRFQPHMHSSTGQMQRRNFREAAQRASHPPQRNLSISNHPPSAPVPPEPVCLLTRLLEEGANRAEMAMLDMAVQSRVRFQCDNDLQDVEVQQKYLQFVFDQMNTTQGVRFDKLWAAYFPASFPFRPDIDPYIFTPARVVPLTNLAPNWVQRPNIFNEFANNPFPELSGVNLSNFQQIPREEREKKNEE